AKALSWTTLIPKVSGSAAGEPHVFRAVDRETEVAGLLGSRHNVRHGSPGALDAESRARLAVLDHAGLGCGGRNCLRPGWECARIPAIRTPAISLDCWDCCADRCHRGVDCSTDACAASFLAPRVRRF